MSSKSALPVPPVRLRNPITSFSIPIIRAEIIMDESLTNPGTLITYCAPQEMVAIDSHTKKKHTTCRVPVMEGGQLKGYVPLPMRYREIWLELCYNIVLLINIWKLWSKEVEKALKPKEKKMATACRRNVGTLLVQYMLARLLAVEELVSLSYNTDPGEECVKVLNEWKVRMLRDWFYMTHSEAKADGPEFMCADPVSAENKAFFGAFITLTVLPAPSDQNRTEMGHRGGWFRYLVAPRGLQYLDPWAYRRFGEHLRKHN
jgi:hypothetical protein